MCINAPFNVVTIGFMESEFTHESTQRLLDAVRSATAGRPLIERVTDWASLTKAMPVSPAVMTNWKRRGLSADGALTAEGRWGVSAWWLLHGETPPAWGAKGGVFSQELTLALARLPADELRRIENGIRGQLDLQPLARSGKIWAA